jgi:NTE family protein
MKVKGDQFMMKSKSREKVTALCLQGGGALGAYEYGVLRALYTKWGPNYRPRVVAGVSIGAINAALLIGAKGDPMQVLDTIWKERFCVDFHPAPWLPMVPSFFDNQATSFVDFPEQNLSWFGNPGMYCLKPEFIFMPFVAPFHNTSIYDTSVLKETLSEFVDLEKLNRPEETRFIITAVNVKTGQQALFDNAHTEITFDHILASSSFPMTFPMTRIDEDFYWDGGICINMPIGSAINALEEVETDNPNVEREVIFVELHRMSGQLPTTLPEAAERFYNLMFSHKINLNKKVHGKYSAFIELIQEIDRNIPQDSPIRQHKGYKDLIRHRKINLLVVIGEKGIGAGGSSNDFSRKTLTHRIEAGFSDAINVFTDVFP